MKFDSKLDYYENMERQRSVRLTTRRTAYRDLSSEAQCWLRGLNERLKAIEEQYAPILKAKRSELTARVADPNDWLDDFELEWEISFYLKEDDPEYDEDDDNILMTIRVHGKHDDDSVIDWGFGNTLVDDAEQWPWFEGESHCYLYRELYDHCGLDWLDLLLIGWVFIDLLVIEQAASMPITAFDGAPLKEDRQP